MRDMRGHSPLRAVVLAAFLLCLTALAEAADHHKELAKHIDAILARPEVARGFWGIEIEDEETGNVIYSHDAARLFTPASNTKLFTTAATLALIGPDHRFRTTVETSAAPDKYGRLSGDLVLIGRGDPNLSGRALPYMLKTERPMPPEQELAELADQVVAHGVKIIDGDVVADDTYYVYERYGEGWAQDDLTWEWGAPVSALAVNDNVVYLNVLPAEHDGDRALVTLSPYAGYFEIDNRVMTSPAGSFPRRIYVQRQPGSNHLEIWGNIPLGDLGASEAVAIEDPAQFCARLLSDLLAKRGVTVYGKTRVRHTLMSSLGTITVNSSAPMGPGEAMPAQATPVVLAEHVSAPLSADVQVTNKVSQNLHAEMMLRLLGREKGANGSIAAGLEVLRGFLSTAGVLAEDQAFFDGSGLSRQNLVTPRATVTLLRYAAKQPWSAQFTTSLPVAGVDGTLASRLKNLPPGATVRAKTGSLDHVNNLAGYLTTSHGDRFVFSIMSNNHTMPSRQATEVIDEILREVEQVRK